MAPNNNVEIARRLMNAFNEEGVEGVLAFYDADCEVYDPDLPGNRPFRGKEGLRSLLELMLTGSEQTEIRDFELLPAGDRVVALIRTYFRGEGGGPEVEVRTDAGLDPELARPASPEAA
jgi:ketosteroid isomerase-like protein